MREFDPVFQNTILFCQKALRKEMEKLTEGMLFQNAAGGDLVRLKVYDQKIPIPKGNPQETEAYASIDFIGDQTESGIVDCPWCKVTVTGGDVLKPNGEQKIQLVIILGIFNDSALNSGYMETVNIIQRILNRFTENPFLEEQFEQVGEINWEINDDQDTFPYTFGAVSLTFKIKGMRKTWGEEFK